MAFNGPEKEQAYVVVLFISCAYGTIASTVNIILIYHMKMTGNLILEYSHSYELNYLKTIIMHFFLIGYIKLILAMSWYQLLYDLTLFNDCIDVDNYPIFYIASVSQLIGGIGSSFISNWIAFILFYVVVFEKAFDIVNNYMYIILSTFIIWLPTAVIYSIGAIPEGSNPKLESFANLTLYYYARLVSIALNFIMIGCIVYKNYRVRSKSTTKTPAEIAINTLCRRVMYYPILQTIGRSGYAWYEFQYGFNFSVSESAHNSERYGLLMYSAIITPTVSIGYLIIFLYIEPHAYKIFKKIFCCIDTPEKDSDDRRSSSRIDGSVLSNIYNSSNNSNIDIIMSSSLRPEQQSISEMARNSERQSAYLLDNTRDSYFTWDVLRTSIANFFLIDDDDYDNRTESEIFAAINESHALNTIHSTAPSEAHLDERRSATRPGISSSIVMNTMHVNNKSDMILNEEHVVL